MNREARRAGCVALLMLAGFGAAAATDARPAPGRHAAELCVATSAAPPSCGPAQAELRRDGKLRVQVDDVIYQLQLHSRQLDVVVMHNHVQIDDFTAPYEWVGSALHFDDTDRNSRYEVRFGDAAKAAGR